MFRSYYQSELQRLALRIADLSERVRFLVTVVDNRTLFRTTPDYQTVIKLYDVEEWARIEALEKSAGQPCRPVDPEPES